MITQEYRRDVTEGSHNYGVKSVGTSGIETVMKM